MVGAFCERAGDHDCGLDPPAGQFGGIGDRQSVHRRFRCEIGRQERRRAAARRGRTDPHQQPLPATAHMRKRRAIDPLRAQNVDVVLLDELFRGEGLGGSEHHVSGVVDDDIEATDLLQDLGDACFRRTVGLDIQLDGAQVEALCLGPCGGFGDARRVTALGLAHRSVDGMAGLGQGAGGHEAEARRGAGDEDDLLGHDDVPLMCLN